MQSLELNPAAQVTPPVCAGFADLLESLRPEILRFAYWLARDRAIAEDVVQETLLRAWRSQASLHDRGAARAWLLTIARREHARLYERRRLELLSLDEGLEEEHVVGAAGVAEQEIAELRDALVKLPLRYRQPLVMQVLGGFTTAEIAHELGLSLTATLTRLFRARNQLRALCGYAAEHVGSRRRRPSADPLRRAEHRSAGSSAR
jgi:RNA polymerase sigma-70 factor (ECF subfamily)